MDVWDFIKSELVRFMGAGQLLEMLADGDYRVLLSHDGLVAFLYLVIPVLLVLELLRAGLTKSFRLEDWKVPFVTMVANRFIGAVISIGMVGLGIAVFQPLAPFQVDIGWIGLLYGYVVWEFSHFIYHYLAHKVRLFWCLHSTHHAPTQMNLSVNWAHIFLEAPYADIIRTSICMLAGVSPPLLIMIMFIDGFWGQAIHLGEGVLKDGRFGFLHKWILTPAHHRVHHAKNVEYMDTNFCNLLNVWDRVFRTYQPQVEGVKFEYGITRPVKPGSFLDAYFGEFYYLGKDVVQAPGLKNKLLYLAMPPGWSHTGDHKTTKVMKQQLRAQREAAEADAPLQQLPETERAAQTGVVA